MERRRCFACKEDKPTGAMKTGVRKNGSRWWLCRVCAADYRAAHSNNVQGTGRVRIGNKGSVELGWNGVPSERALRRRS